MAEKETPRGSGDGAEVEYDDGFVVIDTTDERKARADSGEVPFVITDDTTETKRGQRAQASASVGVDQPLPRQRKCGVCGELGHTARTCPNVGATDRVTRAPRATGNAISPAVPVVLGTINMTVTSLFGENCGISEKETQFMVPAMQRMTERMPKAAAERMAVWIDPVVIVSCFIFWGMRISSIKKAEAQQQYQVAPFEQARANGYAGSNYTVTNEQQSAPANGSTNAAQTPNYGGPTATTGDIDAAMRDRSIQPESTEPTSNGVPQSIRDAFDDRI